MKIKEILPAERPREKMLKYGPEKLTNTELLAILLKNGAKGLNVLELAEKILKKYGRSGLAECSITKLSSTNYGLGETKACEIVACFELGKRFLQNKTTTLLLSPEEVWQELKNITQYKKEHFIVFYLDSGSQIIKKEVIAIGTLNASLIHPREVFEPAIKNNSAQIIIAHNHPSGNSNPSNDDLEITKRLVEAGKIIGIEIIDHVIVTGEKFFSFKKEGVI